MRSRRAVASAALVLALAIPTGAGADYDPLGAGETRVQLDKRFVPFLKRHGVTLSAKRPAKLRGRALILPVSGGLADPMIGKGTIEHEGSIVFRRGNRRLPFRRLTLKVNRTPLIAKVGGGQLRVGRARSTSFARAGFGARVRSVGLRLTPQVATRLNKKLGLRSRPFSGGQRLAAVVSRPSFRTVTILPQGRATLALDPAFLAKMDGLFVSVNPIFPAELAPGATFSVPISRGSSLSPDATRGRLRTLGAIEFLQQGAGQVFVDELRFEREAGIALSELEIRPAPIFRGKLGQVPTLAVSRGAVASDPEARTIAVSGAALALGQEAAASFNEAFAQGNAAFAAGEPLGTLSFVAQAK